MWPIFATHKSNFVVVLLMILPINHLVESSAVICPVGNVMENRAVAFQAGCVYCQATRALINNEAVWMELGCVGDCKPSKDISCCQKDFCSFWSLKQNRADSLLHRGLSIGLINALLVVWLTASRSIG